MSLSLYEVDKYYDMMDTVKGILNDSFATLANIIYALRNSLVQFYGQGDRSKEMINSMVEDMRQMKQDCVALFLELDDMRKLSNNEITNFTQLKNYITANSRNALNLLILVHCHRALLVTQSKIVDYNLVSLAVIETINNKSAEIAALVVDGMDGVEKKEADGAEEEGGHAEDKDEPQTREAVDANADGPHGKHGIGGSADE